MIETQTPVAAPVETVTPIKPSEALRLGRLIHPVHNDRGTWRDVDGSACALGVIAAGWGFPGIDRWGTSDAAVDRLAEFDVDHTVVFNLFDFEESEGRDGDAAVLAYLESRGL